MKVIEKKVSELIPYENNPRYNDEAVQYVKNSIEQFGFQVPIVIDKDDVVVCGHTRLKAVEELGYETVPCVVADNLTEEQIKAFRIADNKVTEKSTWDIGLLQGEIQAIENIDMLDFGFNEFELLAFTDDSEPERYDDELIDKYSRDEDELLEVKRVIITYKGDDQKNFLRKLLKETDDELKVVYKAENLI